MADAEKLSGDKPSIGPVTVDSNDQKSPHSSLDDAHNNPYFAGSSAKPPPKWTLPPFLQHLKKPKSLKIWFRCCVAIWVSTILMFIDPVLKNFGQATFFGGILLMIAPPSGVVLIGLLGPVTAALGMCVAWAWGVITMKAAQATRPARERAALLVSLQQAVVAHTQNTEQATGQSTYTSELIFNGFALDARVVITYFCMLGLFLYLIARIRVAAPKLILFQIFSTIVTDIFLTTAPLLPTFEGAIPQVLIKPAVTALAISIVCNLLIFPESTSHAALEGFEQVLGPMRGFLDACLQSFEHHPIQFDVAKLEATRAAVIGAYQALGASLGFLELDWSMGRWNSKDIASLKEPLREALTMFLGLVQMQITVSENTSRVEWFHAIREALYAGGDKGKLPTHAHHQLLAYLEGTRKFPREEQSQLFGESMRALADSSSGIIHASGDALDAILEAIHDVNTRRWFNRSSVAQCEEMSRKHRVILHTLEVERRKFAEMNREHLLDPHSHLFDQDGRLKLHDDPLANPIRSLLRALVFEEKMLSGADSLHDLLEKIVGLEEHRTHVTIWPPTKLRHAVRWAIGHESAPSSAPVNYDDLQPTMSARERSDLANRKLADSDSDEGDGKESSAQRELDALHVSGARKRSKRDRYLIGAIKWFTSTEGLYAFRILVVSMALALPAVIKHSSGFFYRERGLWALIMAQTGLVTFSADFIFGLLSRIAGTILGGVMGMVAWYIGAGNGPGNPYGMAAIVVVFIMIFMYCRLFAPPQYLQGVMLSGASFYLIIGYSWDDEHIPNYGNPGVGYNVFWRRTLLVIIGFSAAAIVTFFPKPPSATRDIANILAANLRASKDLYALLLTSWAAPQKDLVPVVQKAVIASVESLNALPPRIAMLRFEFTTTNLDPAVLTKVRRLCQSINQHLSQLFTYVVRLPPEMKARFASLSGATDDRLVGDIMAVMSLLEQSLKTGDALPAVLPCPLVLRSVNYQTMSGQGEHAHYTSTPEGAGDIRGALTLSMVRQPDFRRYCVVLNAFTGLLGSIDELVFELKGSLGEEHVIADWEANLWQKGGEA